MSDELELIVVEAIEALESKDSLVAIELLSQGSIEEALPRFASACHELFTQRKLTRMVWIGRAGVELALRAGDDQSRLFARKFTYNLASNLWPGWGDDAVEPTSSDLLAAVDLPRIHRRLVEAEQGSPDTLANARWLVGALRLAIGQEQSAHHEFESAKSLYREAGQLACETMAEGYQALALLFMGTMAGEGQRRFDAAVASLRQQGDDGEFFADQLMTARRVFLKK